jgi:hypothetical protein
MSAQLRQGTLSFHSSGAPSINRPGPCPKAPTSLTPALSLTLFRGARQRRLVSGINEQAVEKAFTNA